MEAFNTLFDQLVLHQVRLMQLSVLYEQEARSHIDATEEEAVLALSALASYLQRQGGYRAGDTRIVSLVNTALAKITEVRRGGYVNAFEAMSRNFDNLVSYELQFMTSALKPHANLNVPSVTGQSSLKVQGFDLSTWRSRLQNNDLARLSQGVSFGTRLGENEAQLRARLIGHESYRGADGLTVTSRNELNALVRTATDTFADLARVQINMENPLIGKEVYVAILDSRTTDTCSNLHGSLHGPNDGPRPPIHWYCRSVRVPALGQSKPVLPSYREWLQRIPNAAQNEVLGASQATQFRAGTLDVANFREPNWRGITLETMAKRERSVFEEAGVDIPFQ